MALLSYSDLTPDALNVLRSRIHNLFWKNHAIGAQSRRGKTEPQWSISDMRLPQARGRGMAYALPKLHGVNLIRRAEPERED
ncbi:hypothetical protein [Paraburkholderia mimosarum]|uniref:hypothetical protein n=1 Tax=Paraburkholderia mimosarum TaxID=312026 RepID=UPI0007C5A879|nr:hypothetical protein [Paraburkholderia mimosarum]